jgi:hypothetical protein
LEDVIRDPLNGIGDLIPMHFARARQRSQNQQIERSGRNFVLMQSITPDIVRLRHHQIVSGSCQDVCEDARFAQETRLEAGFRTDGRYPEVLGPQMSRKKFQLLMSHVIADWPAAAGPLGDGPPARDKLVLRGYYFVVFRPAGRPVAFISLDT